MCPVRWLFGVKIRGQHFRATPSHARRWSTTTGKSTGKSKAFVVKGSPPYEFVAAARRRAQIIAQEKKMPTGEDYQAAEL